MNDLEISRVSELPEKVMLKERELAARWNISLRTLQRWRAAGTGPAFLSLGGAIRYRLDDVLSFEAGRRVSGGDEA